MKGRDIGQVVRARDSSKIRTKGKEMDKEKGGQGHRIKPTKKEKRRENRQQIRVQEHRKPFWLRMNLH